MGQFFGWLTLTLASNQVATGLALFWFGVENYIIWGLLAGVLIPVMARLNGTLATTTGNAKAKKEQQGSSNPNEELQKAQAKDSNARDRENRDGGGNHAEPEAAGPLERLLTDPDPRVRSAAAQALGAVGRESAARALNGLLMDPDSVLASAAEDALVQIADRLDRPDLRPRTDY